MIQTRAAKRLATLGVVLVVLGSAVTPADAARLRAEVSSEPTGTPLEYAYTIKLTDKNTGEAVEGAKIKISTDMPSMPGAHHMRPVIAEPGDEPGVYHAKILFDMVGEWSLIMRISGPTRDQIVHMDHIRGPGDGGHSGMKMDHGSKMEGSRPHDMKRQ